MGADCFITSISFLLWVPAGRIVAKFSKKCYSLIVFTRYRRAAI
ncbi:unnamed protein product [Ixodes pacificus]